jgi:hypothetical protein
VRIGDGWLASAYNTTPDGFARAWQRLRQEVADHGGDPDAFDNGLATLWFHLGDDAEVMLTQRLAPAVHRPGLQRVFVWPVADDLEQLHRFSHDVMPLLPS